MARACGTAIKFPIRTACKGGSDHSTFEEHESMTRFQFSTSIVLALTIAACAESPIDPVARAIRPDFANGPSTQIVDQASLQAALDAASSSIRATKIRVSANANIVLVSTLTYSGSASLHLQGHGATIVGPADGNAFEATGGGDLRLDDLTVKESGGHGIYVEVPTGRTGTQRVELNDVALVENGFAGLWVDDQENDSPASLEVVVNRTAVIGNNTAGLGTELDYGEVLAAADKDGIRVNEGGIGNLVLIVQNSLFEDNQADGLELDEVGEGDVRATVRHSSFLNNGAQLQFPVDVPTGFPGDPADYEPDLEDGFDIDEADAGSIHATLIDVFATGHMDEGIDLDELNAGSVFATFTRVTSIANQDDNVSVTESEEVDDPGIGEGEGDIVIDFRQVDASEQIPNGDGDGIKLEEFGNGIVDAQIVSSRVSNNDDDGIQIDEDGGDGGLLRLQSVLFEGNDDDDVNSDVPVVQVP
jgi:hypothetical protein